MKVILDANVLIAAAASRGLCEAVVELCLERHQLVLCEAILSEVNEKLCRKTKVPHAIVAEYLKVFRTNAQLLEPEAVAEGTCRDPKDLMILGLVAPGNARAIVTGDKDLLVLKAYKNARIMLPRAFWESSKRDV